MVHPPRFWWLLAPTLLMQGAFFLRLAVFRLSGTRFSDPSKVWLGVFLTGCTFGAAYGVVQSDAVFIVGQACAVVAALVGAKRSTTK